MWDNCESLIVVIKAHSELYYAMDDGLGLWTHAVK